MTDKHFLHVRIRDSQSVVFEGEADRISSYNEVGKFDVFPMHANFISIINQEIILYNGHEKIKELKIEQAVLKVKKDNAHIFLGIEALAMEETNEKIQTPPPGQSSST